MSHSTQEHVVKEKQMSITGNRVTYWFEAGSAWYNVHLMHD